MRWWRSVGGGLAGGLVGLLVYDLSLPALPLRECQAGVPQTLAWLVGGAAVAGAIAVLVAQARTWWPRVAAATLALLLAVPSAGVLYAGTVLYLGDLGVCPPR